MKYHVYERSVTWIICFGYSQKWRIFFFLTFCNLWHHILETPAWLMWSTFCLSPHAGPRLTPSHSNATRASGIDSSLKFLLCQCWPFLPECFWTEAMNQISCSSHSSLLCALVLSIWLSHLSGPRGSAGDRKCHQDCEGRKLHHLHHDGGGSSSHPLHYRDPVWNFAITCRSSLLLSCGRSGADHRHGEGRGKAESSAERARAAMQMTLGDFYLAS